MFQKTGPCSRCVDSESLLAYPGLGMGSGMGSGMMWQAPTGPTVRVRTHVLLCHHVLTSLTGTLLLAMQLGIRDLGCEGKGDKGRREEGRTHSTPFPSAGIRLHAASP